MTVEDAARVLGVSPQFVRRGLQQGRLPIGAAVMGKSRWSYHISEHLLNQYTGEKPERMNTWKESKLQKGMN